MATTPKELNLEGAVESITNWAYSDSHVEVDDEKLRQALVKDKKSAGRYPTALECEQMICGDEDGEIPEKFDKLFPNTMNLLETYW